ncbi:MAG: GNAT family N-acetyltransferase [Pseudomonadota bacterium]
MSEITIRPACRSDAETIGVIGHAAWRKGIVGHVGPAARARIGPETFADFAESHTAQIVVAEDDDALLGFAATETGDNTISDLWVAPVAEGRGVGTSLMRALEAIIAERGHEQAEVEVLAENHRALSLYRHLGYEVVWRGVRDDQVLLVPLTKILLSKRL